MNNQNFGNGTNGMNGFNNSPANLPNMQDHLLKLFNDIMSDPERVIQLGNILQQTAKIEEQVPKTKKPEKKKAGLQ